MDKRTERYNTKLKADLAKLDNINKHLKSFKDFWAIEEAEFWVEISDELKVQYWNDGEIVYEGETLGEVLAFLEGLSNAKESLLNAIEDIADNWTIEDKKKLFESLRTNGCWI